MEGSSRRRVLAAIAATVAVALALLVPSVGTAGEATTTWGQAVEITPPANAASSQEARLSQIACPASGSCVAVGDYADSSGNQYQAMVVSETGGVWGQASEITPPVNAGINPDVYLSQVACPASGSCVAVGDYENPFNGQAIVVSETAGVWSQASEVTLPANAASNPHASLKGIVCPASGSCVAVGEYQDESSGNSQAMVVSETDGVWGQATEITPPVNAESTPGASLSYVACSAPDSCVASGGYEDDSVQYQAMLVSETGGVWGQASEVTLPTSGRGQIDGVACSASGSCVAVGEYRPNNPDGGPIVAAIVMSETGGVWGQASEVTLDTAYGPVVVAHLSGVACPASGPCAAVGEAGVVVSETDGEWEQASAVTPPLNAGSNNEANLSGVACPASGSCVAVGEYKDSLGDYDAMVVSETDGVWDQANEITPPVNAEGSLDVDLGQVACLPPGSCAAVGDYSDRSGYTRAMVVNTTSFGEVSSSAKEKEESTTTAKESSSGGSSGGGGSNGKPMPQTNPTDFACPPVSADKKIHGFDATYLLAKKSSPFDNISAQIGEAAACRDAQSGPTSSWVMLQSAPNKTTTSCSFLFIHCTKNPQSLVQAGLIYHPGGEKPDHVFAEIEYPGFQAPSGGKYKDTSHGGLVVHNEEEDGMTVEFLSEVYEGRFGVAVLPTVYRSFDKKAQQCTGEPSDAKYPNIQGAEPSKSNPEKVVQTTLEGKCLWDFFLPTKVASIQPLVAADLAAEVFSNPAAVPGTYPEPLKFSKVVTQTTDSPAEYGFHPSPTGTKQKFVNQVGCQSKSKAGSGSSYTFSIWARTAGSCGG